jgi:hypothetical protein
MGDPGLFVAFFLAVLALLFCGYFLARQAVIDAHLELRRRDKEAEDRRRRGG